MLASDLLFTRGLLNFRAGFFLNLMLLIINHRSFGELLIRQNWKQLFHWRWLLALVLITIFISPELYCLWKQFDQHPEKIVLESQKVSGIKFFLWDSQFGLYSASACSPFAGFTLLAANDDSISCPHGRRHRMPEVLPSARRNRQRRSKCRVRLRRLVFARLSQ